MARGTAKACSCGQGSLIIPLPGGRVMLIDVSDEARRIFEAAMQLPDAERAALASVLKDSVGDGSSLEEIEAAWIAEAERRRDDLRAGRTTAVPWQDVRREIFEMIEHARERRATG